MGVSKVTLNGVTLMDVTDKTVDTDNLLAGNSALRNDGESITGAVVTASPSDVSPAMDGTASAGVATTYSRGDHVHPSDTNKANINNPSFTGIPTAPTASKGTNTTQIATTAFVQSAIADINYPVTSVNSKTGTVVLTASDVNALPDDTEIPTKTSDLTNDSGYITNSDIPVTSVNTKTGDVVLTAADVNAQPQINISGILKGNGTGTITAATAGTDYQAPLPSQTGNTGKFLTTNGSALSWQTVDALPSQSGNTGKFLTTNGSSASWAEVDVPTKTSDLTNDSNFITAAGAPVQSVNSKTGAITLTASDVGALPDSTDVTKWNGVSLTKTSSNHYSGYVPYMSATDSTSATLQAFSSTRTSGKIAAWDSSGYLYSSTPTARDNSGKVATTEYVDSAISGLGSILNYKGTKATESALPSTGNVTGDVWIVSADSSEYVWNGTAWEKFGPTIDLSGYVPTTRTVNGKALSTDISLDASDVGALPDSTVIPDISGKVNKSGDTMTGNLIFNSDAKIRLKYGSSSTYTDIGASGNNGGTTIIGFTSNLTNNKVILDNIAAPTDTYHAANKKYVDDKVAAITVPVTSVNSKTGDVVLTAADVGALPDSTTYVSSVNGNSGAITVTDEKLKTTSQNTQGNMQYVLTGTSSDTASTKNYANNLQFGQNSNNGSATLAVGSSSYKGRLRLFNNASGSFYTNLNPSAVSNNLDVDLPSSSGTLALISNIPDSTSDLTNDSGFITSSDIPVTSVNSKTGAVVLDAEDVGALPDSTDVTKWGTATLGRSGANVNADTYIPQFTSQTATSTNMATATKTPTNYAIAKYDSDAYLNSTTPATSDNSTKVATTAFVKTAISNIDVLPSQTSHNGDFLTTNGTVASWESLPKEVFVATYGTTTLAEILEAYNAGKFIYAVKSNNPGRLVPLEEYVSSIPQFYFSYITRGGAPQDWAVSNSGWTSTANTFGYVPTTRTINSKSLSNSITLTASDVGALPDSTTIPTATSDLTNDSGFITSSDIPVTSVNNKTGAVSLTASDVGALPDSTDVTKWNDVPLVKNYISNSGNAAIPYITNNGDSYTAHLVIASNLPNTNGVAKYDEVGPYLRSTTPSANDNSTKVATTAYVDNAVAGAGSGAKGVTNPALTASEGIFTWSIAAADAFSSPNVIISVYDTAAGAIVYPDIVVNQTTGAVTITIRDTTSVGSLAAGAYRAVMIG